MQCIYIPSSKLRSENPVEKTQGKDLEMVGFPFVFDLLKEVPCHSLDLASLLMGAVLKGGSMFRKISEFMIIHAPVTLVGG
jgi:hypothetical protein